MGTRRSAIAFRRAMAAAVAVTALVATGLEPWPAWAQESPPAEAPPTPAPTATPIPAADIPRASDNTDKLLRSLVGAAEPLETVEIIEKSIAETERRIENMLPDTLAQLEGTMSRSSLEDLARQWVREANGLDKLLGELQRRTSGLVDNLAQIDGVIELWTKTRQSADEQDFPPVVREVVNTTLASAHEARRQVAGRRDQVLTLQTAASKSMKVVEETLLAIQQRVDAQRKSIFLPEQSVLWHAEWAPRDRLSLGERVRSRYRVSSQAVISYVIEEPARILPHAALFLGLCAALVAFRRRAVAWAHEDANLQKTARLLSRPVAGAVLLSTLVDEWFHPDAPQAWENLLSLVLLVAMLRLLPPLLPKTLLLGPLLLVILYIVDRVLVVLPEETLLFRLTLLLLSAIAMGSLVWLGNRLRPLEQKRGPVWIRLMYRVCRLGAALCGGALLANVLGAVSLAENLTEGSLAAVYTAILMWTGTLVLRGAVAVGLKTRTAQKLNMVRHDANRILNATDTGIHLLAALAWAHYTLQGFGLLQPVRDVVVQISQSTIQIGEWSFTPLAILPVLLVVWLSFKISKFVRFVLELDVLSRVSLPRGVPGTILTITNYIVLAIGFFIVVAMLGVDLTKLTILAGALGVGIGFGLQNVVNNFVSGLILLFERPIKEGDKIEIGTISGVVTQIGMRASIVRTWQGAEVIVPNADLISKELTNWTLYDLKRRVEIPVGVAYGSDPEVVLSTLFEVAQDHPEVLDDPAPAALFIGFGDSSLNFELRAWTLEDFVRVRSELVVATNRALKEAGFEIPFPQRDVHIRTGGTPETSGTADD